ncbi:MAG TPA: VWA domain-containing protein [Terracidiphilus sp.]|nr:VWA domain-containing protein [Terracidiphilus sp.]
MLRKILIFGLLAAIAGPSHAEKRLSVAKLERLLAEDAAAHKQDAEIARQIEGIVLTERMPDATFAQLAARFSSGSRTSAALRLLTDASQFQEPAPDNYIAKAAPDSAAQARMLDAAREYVSKTLQRLPNFLSTRIVSRYDDTPQSDKPGDWPTRTGLHLVTTARIQTSVSFERDNQPPAEGSAAWGAGTGLVSGGEFGTTLGMVLADMSKGEVSWSRWERTSAGILAVFHYSVPGSTSHFEVFSSLRPETSTTVTRSTPNSRGVSVLTAQQNPDSRRVQLVRARPAYQGSIWMDPVDGTVYRITMETDAKMGLPVLRRAAILVEYGPVEVGGQSYICPVRSLAEAEAVTSTESRLGDDATAWLNETAFAEYHRFGSSVRVLEEEAKGAAREPAPNEGVTVATNAGEETAQNTGVSAPAQVAQEKAPAFREEQAATTTTPVPASAIGATAAEDRSKGNETSPVPIAASAASSAPPMVDKAVGQSAQATSDTPGESGMTLHVNVNSLLVPTVVLNKNGEAVGDLGETDFVVTDNGRQRKITGFTLVRGVASGAKDGEAKSAMAESTGGAASMASEPQRDRYLVFLFDDRHMNVADLSLIKKAASRLFERPLPEGEYADVLSLMGADSGISREDAALESAVMKLASHQVSQNVKENCPNVDYYAADQIIRHHNAEDFQLAVQNAKQCSMLQANASSSTDPYSAIDNPTDPFQRAAMRAAENALATGDEDARESLLAVRNVMQAMSKMPGQRIVILVSPGLLALSEETKELESQIMDIAAASEVTINALDARGLVGAGFDASQGGTSLGLVTGQLVQEQIVSMQVSQGVLSELAAGTGGRFFHDNNDLQGGLEKLAAAPEYLYLLEVSLQDVKANGSYHQLRVRVDRPGVEVLARKGYAAPGKDERKK